MLESLETHGCKLETKQEDEILGTFKDALSNVKSYANYFERIGLPAKNKDEINTMLKTAVKNSKEKRYHGDVDHVIGLPKEEVQIKEYLSKIPTVLDQVEDGKLKDLTEEEWRDLCFNRWQWMRNYYNAEYERTTTPALLAQEQENRDKTDFIYQSEEDEVYQSVFAPKYDLRTGPREFYGNRGISNYPSDFTWQQLYVKLDLEDCIATLNHHQDFKGFYDRLDVVGSLITTFTLYITPCNKLKSGYFYLCATLNKLTNLQVLNIQAKGLGSNQVTYKAITNLKKGFNKLNATGKSQLVKLRITSTQFLNAANTSDAMLEIFNSVEKLTSIELKSTNVLLMKENKIANAIIVNHPDIRELHIVSACNNDENAKSIADGLMRAKKLEYLVFNSNRCTVGITNLLYNLAFSPKLTVLDLSSSGVSNVNDFNENLTKLVSISGSIEYLNLNGVYTFSNFKQDFFKALGENTSLKYLDFSNSNNSSTHTNVGYLAHALAINAESKGNISELIGQNLMNYGQFSTFINDMWTNAHLKETWYGDAYKAEKMGGTDREKSFICNLKTLDIMGATISCACFNYEKYIKEISNGMPEWVKLFILGSKLEKLGLESTGLTANHFESLRAALDKGLLPKHVQGNMGTELQVSNIQRLNLRKNRILKDGAKSLKQLLGKFTSLEYLQLDHCKLGVAGAIHFNEFLNTNATLRVVNLASNKIEVDGGRNLGKVLSQNKTLEFIDIGFCKIRDEGLRKIAEGIASNAATSIKCLGLRSNLLSDAAFQNFITTISANTSNKINSILFRGNA